MISVERASFESRISTLIPAIQLQFGLDEEGNKPGRFVLLKHTSVTEDNPEKDRVRDHQLFQVLQMLLKLCAQCPSFLKQTKEIEFFATHVQTLLAHPHEWVRLSAAQFLGFVSSVIDVNHLSELLLQNKTDEVGYLCNSPSNSIKSLALDLCAQLQPGIIKEDLAQQVIKNLVFVARVLQKIPINNTESNQKLNLLWLTKRMRKIVNMEVVVAPTSTVLRTEVFKWIGGIGTALNIDKIKAVLHHLLAPLIRELLTTEESNAPLRQLAKHVANLLKKRVGLETYTDIMSKVEHQISVKRAERKRTKRQLAVTDPEMYAKKKIKRHEKKKEGKKRKLDQMKGTKRKFKRRKAVDLENDEIM